MSVNSKSLLLITMSFLVASFLFDVSATAGGRLGGWTPIADPKAPEVLELGQFAVTEHNYWTKANLAFETVLMGWTQVVAGTNYKLHIAAKDGSTTNRYEAIIYVRPWEHFRNLTSFQMYT